MYIFQPDRFLITQQIKKFGHYIKGKTLDVGAGDFNRYQKFFQSSEYIKMDVRTNGNADLIGSADEIPEKDGNFDSVVSTQVFEHLKNPDQAAREISRVLKPGGHVLITVPQWNELHEEPHDYYRYTKYGIAEIFERNGFKTVLCDQRGGFFTQIAQIQIRYLLDKFNLHNHPYAGWGFSKVFWFCTKIAIWFDRLDKSVANRKHALGWLFVFRKF